MPAASKELERSYAESQPMVPETSAMSYVEKVERGSEIQNDNSSKTTPNDGVVAQASTPIPEMRAEVKSEAVKKKITLPLTRSQVENGLHGKIYSGITWAANWCVMMIKKYPGRVFYLPAQDGL